MITCVECLTDLLFSNICLDVGAVHSAAYHEPHVLRKPPYHMLASLPSPTSASMLGDIGSIVQWRVRLHVLCRQKLAGWRMVLSAWQLMGLARTQA